MVNNVRKLIFKEIKERRTDNLKISITHTGVALE